MSQCPKYEEKCDHAAWKSDAESSFLTTEFKMLYRKISRILKNPAVKITIRNQRLEN